MAVLVSAHVEDNFRRSDMNQKLTKTLIFTGLPMLALLVQSCGNDDARKELGRANNDLRQENRELREKVAAVDKQLAQLAARSDELQRANEAAGQKAIGGQIVTQEETKNRLEAEARLRTEQIKQQAVATVGKIAARMERLLEEIPSLENSLFAWDAAMPKLATFAKDGSLQINSLVAELDGLKFERSGALKLKIASFSNGYQSLPGIGRMVVSSRERAAALRAVSDPSKPDSDPGVGEEVTMTAQLSVFNATIVECKKLQAEVSQLAN